MAETNKSHSFCSTNRSTEPGPSRSVTAVALTPNSAACAASSSPFLRAASPTIWIFGPGRVALRARTTSSVCTPIDPVEPSTITRVGPSPGSIERAPIGHSSRRPPLSCPGLSFLNTL
ncbi:MAG: hypothetical protein QM783_00810 [Phycisphaerales bacterium]